MYSSMICGVASTEPPSVITISSGGRVCASKLSSSSRIERSSSLTGTTTLTFIGNNDQSRFHTKAQRKTQSHKEENYEGSICAFAPWCATSSLLNTNVSSTR